MSSARSGFPSSRSPKHLPRDESPDAEAERVSGRVQEHPERRAGLMLVQRRAELEHRGLPGVEVVDDDVEVHLLRHLLPRPLGRGVALDLLEADALPVVGADLGPAGSELLLPVQHRAVEGRERVGVGTVEDDAREACDSHDGDARPYRRQVPRTALAAPQVTRALRRRNLSTDVRSSLPFGVRSLVISPPDRPFVTGTHHVTGEQGPRGTMSLTYADAHGDLIETLDAALRVAVRTEGVDP